jgi:two-component sensor histidine kinase
VELRWRGSRIEDQVEVEVRDNGIGLPAGFDLAQAKGLGLRIVHILTKRLDGKVHIDNDDGAAFTLRFPLHGETPVEPRDE